MSLLPEQVAGKTFERRRRGYDTAQVSAFLQRVAADYAAAIHRIAVMAEDGPARQARQAIEQARREGDDDARAIRDRAEQAAALIIRHAEDIAAALAGQAERLRDTARQDADAAQARLTQARQHAAELEQQTMQRCDTARAQADEHQQRLRAIERTVAERLRVIEHATAALRSRLGVLDQVEQLEELIDTIRAEVRAGLAAGA